jgi:hypothetical protein
VAAPPPRPCRPHTRLTSRSTQRNGAAVALDTSPPALRGTPWHFPGFRAASLRPVQHVGNAAACAGHAVERMHVGGWTASALFSDDAMTVNGKPVQGHLLLHRLHLRLCC